MQHHFDIEVAQEYGINLAILINHFQFWLTKNVANGKNQHDGRTWTYNSRAAMLDIFPYLSDDIIRNALNKGVEMGVLVKGNYNKAKYDRTNWYAFADEAKWLNINNTGKSPMEDGKIPNGTLENPQPIPDNKTYNITDNIISGEMRIKESFDAPDALTKELYTHGINYMTSCGVQKRTAGAMIGKWKKKYSETDILHAIKQTIRNKPGNPIPYITRILNPVEPEPDIWDGGLDLTPIAR